MCFTCLTLMFLSRQEDGPKKTITIRGVDRDLYDQFSHMATLMGHNVGDFFSNVIQRQNHHRSHLAHFGRRIILKHGQSKDDAQIETISYEDELIISRDDLVDAGDMTRFIFRGIKRLEFDKTVDNQTLLKHVERISKCDSVVTRGDVSKLFLLSISDSTQRTLPIGKNLKDVTIRNVREAAYEQFRNTCQLSDENLGTCFNTLLSKVIPHLEIMQILIQNQSYPIIEPLIVSIVDKISVSERDLVDLEDREVVFHRINNLAFNLDIPKSIFIAKVKGIYNCGEISLPKSTPKLIVKSRVKNFVEQ